MGCRKKGIRWRRAVYTDDEVLLAVDRDMGDGGCILLYETWTRRVDECFWVWTRKKSLKLLLFVRFLRIVGGSHWTDL